MCHPPSTWMCSHTRKLPEPHTLGIVMEASSSRHDWSLTKSAALLSFPFMEDEGRIESSKLLIMACCFWWTDLTQEPTEHCPIRTKDTPITQEIRRVLGALCQELGAETNMYFVYCFTLALNFWVGFYILMPSIPKDTMSLLPIRLWIS